jgi:hypothetical protein
MNAANVRPTKLSFQRLIVSVNEFNATALEEIMWKEKNPEFE